MAKNVKFDIRAENKSRTAFNDVKRSLGGLTSSLTSMKGLLIGGGLIAGTAALAKGLQTVTKAAMVQKQAEADLGAVLKSTGEAAGFNLNQLKNMASGLQAATTFGDELTLSGMAILATFKNIRGEAFERTTKAAMDMSTVMKQDLKSSMIMLGKAINDPVANLSALSRAGVQFTKEQKALIKEMVLSGDLMEAQALILDELESQFGGAAEAAGGPFAKALGQLQNVWGDLLEEMGFAFTENEAFIGLLNQMKEIIISWIPVVGNLVDSFIDWIGPADELNGKLNSLFQTLQFLGNAFRTVAKIWDNTVGRMIGAWGQVAGMAYTIGENIVNLDNPLSGVSLPEFSTGTGPQGLPSTGPFVGHQGEVVLNPAESEAYRKGGGGVNITISPQFMTGDRGAARAVAQEIQKELNGLNNRWGATS